MYSSRDCTAPKDWSRVKCSNCEQMGHTVKRCKEPIKEDNGFGGGDDAGFGGGEDAGFGAGGDGGAGWETPGAAPVSAGGW